MVNERRSEGPGIGGEDRKERGYSEKGGQTREEDDLKEGEGKGAVPCQAGREQLDSSEKKSRFQLEQQEDMHWKRQDTGHGLGLGGQSGFVGLHVEDGKPV